MCIVAKLLWVPHRQTFLSVTNAYFKMYILFSGSKLPRGNPMTQQNELSFWFVPLQKVHTSPEQLTYGFKSFYQYEL